MNSHPLATSVATAVADRALERLGAQLATRSGCARSCPGARSRTTAATTCSARFADWFGGYDTVVLSDVAGDDVGDRVLVHYKLDLRPRRRPRVLTQTLVCSSA